MLFDGIVLLAGGATLLIACLDKTLESFGFHMMGTILKIAIPLVGLAAGIYFIETNPLIWWLR